MAITITSFTAGAGTINLGSSTTLTAVFSGGTAVVVPGNIPITSGVAITVTPTSTTKYTLLVQDTAGNSAVASATITVTIPALRKLGVGAGGGVLVGMNSYWVDTKPVYNIIVNVNPMSMSDHIAHTNEETIAYDITVNGSSSFQIVGITDLNSFLTEFGLTWA